MAEFEILDDIQKPLKNKKLKPIMIAGVIIVVAVVLYQKGSTGNGQTTEYIGTYAGNTGATTEVSNMLDDYKTTVSGMLDDQQSSYSDQMGGYMEQLNAMFDANMNAYDYQYQQKLEQLEQQLAQMGTGTVGGVNAGSRPSGGSVADNNDLVTKAPTSGNSGGSSGSKGGANNSIESWREDYAATPAAPEGGQMFINDWAHHVHANDSGTGSSFSDLSNHDTDYYYGGVTSSKVDTITSQHSSSGFTSKYDGSQVGKGVTETIVTREDGSRVVSYTPNADHWTRK